jgi:hypothetical protein
MRFVSAIFAIILLLVGKQFGFSQSFVNLDFEAATVPQTQAPGLVNGDGSTPRMECILCGAGLLGVGRKLRKQ